MVTKKAPKKLWVYKRLVTSDDDVVGLVAYGFYKSRKTELADGYRRKGLDEATISQKLKEFHDQVVSGNGEVEQYRQRAELYLDSLLAATHAHAKSEAIDRIIDTAKREPGQQKAWHKELGAWLVSGLPSAIATLVLTILVLGAMLFFARKEHKAVVASELVNQMVGEDVVAPKASTGDAPKSKGEQGPVAPK